MTPLSVTVRVTDPPGPGCTILFGNDLAEAEEKGTAEARFLLGNDDARMVATITIEELCPKCGGTGRCKRPRSKWSYDPCKPCQATGTKTVHRHYEVTR
jgi:hypothetical protein